MALVREYAESNSEGAFATLVSRHVNLVYSVALRQVQDPHLAEEITQSVFIILARKAKSLSPKTILSGWLCRTARYVCADTLKIQRRRQIREQESQMQSILNEPDPGVWNHIAPLLDEALNCLGEKEHDAVVLRFFDGKELKQVGAAMGTTEDAARMRVNRGLEKLRECLAKRGVTLSATVIAGAVAANSVQAAPAGLAVAITAALSGTTTITTTAVIAATKAIAMTTLQKTLVTATVALLAGAGIYEARQASQLRGENQTLQQQQSPLAEQIADLRRERDQTARQLALLREENERLGRNTEELLRLRAEAARLRADTQQARPSKNAGSLDPIESAANLWVDRVARLKQRLEQTPQVGIPELRLLSEEDWLAAVKGQPLETDTDYRRALSTLRRAAEGKAGGLMQKAAQAFASGNNGQFPTDLAQLQPYFDSPMDAAILDRWTIESQEAVPSVGVGNPIITERAPVDEVFDQRLVFSQTGSGSTDFLNQAIWGTMQPVFEAYRAAHNGQWQTDFSQLLPYATTPEQQAAVQKMILRNSGTK